MATNDPFHHLHDEDYAQPYLTKMATAETFYPHGGRPVESLNGDWWLTLDLFDEGLRQAWFRLDETPPSQWATPRDYEIEAGERVPVPSCWNRLKPEWTYFEGAAWYTRQIDWTPGPAGERVMLSLGAANYLALVFLNGIPVGGHRGGSTPFTLDVTAALQPGPNRLQIMVENRRSPLRVPMQHIDWFNYGGLYRDVALMRLPAIAIRQAIAALAPDGRAITATIMLDQPVDLTGWLRIPALGIDVPIAIRAGRGEAECPFTGTPWSPETPVCYDVVFEAGEDRFVDRIGFRTVATRGMEILLNGRPIWLKGACVHEDDRDHGKVSDEADIRRRFRHLKELGANFARLSHYPHHELVARIADEEGILLWAEIPVYWAIAFDHPETYADAENQLRELITRDINRASVMLWGVGNENADTDARLAFMAGLATVAKVIDPTRLVGAACLINRRDFTIEDRLADHLDVIGLNEYFGWYEPDFSGLDRLLANSAPDKPVIISETGADALPGYRAAGRVLFSEDWQAEFYRQQWARITATPYIAGFAAWLLYDFRTERRQTGYQRGWNRKGLIAEDKATKKQAFCALQEAFARHRNQE
jgi:beta-glucuronidase